MRAFIKSVGIALLAAVCLSSSGCIAALYNYDVEIESAEAVSEITAQTPKEAASTDGSETPDAVYQAKLDSLPRDDRAGRKEVFNEWVKAKYPGPYEIYTPTEDEKWLFYDLKYWTAYDFCCWILWICGLLRSEFSRIRIPVR